jgi:CRISPR-associated endonuclease/helicase Cas3
MEYYCYWGKARPDAAAGATYHLLVYHSLDVAAVGRTVLDSDQKLSQRLIRNTGLKIFDISHGLGSPLKHT